MVGQAQGAGERHRRRHTEIKRHTETKGERLTDMATETEREKHRMSQMETLRDRDPEIHGAREASWQRRDSTLRDTQSQRETYPETG